MSTVHLRHKPLHHRRWIEPKWVMSRAVPATEMPKARDA